MRAVLARLSLAAVGLAVCLLLGAGMGYAAGSGYNQSYAQAAPVPIADVALIGLNSQDPGGSNLTVSLSVAGTFVLDNGSYAYWVLFTPALNFSSALTVLFSNNSTGSYVGPVSGSIAYTLQDDGSTLSFSIAKAILPSADGLGLSASASASIGSSRGTTLASSGIGALGASGSCSGPLCTGDPGGGGASPFSHVSGLAWIAVAALGAVAVVALVVVVLRQRRDRRPPSTEGPPAPNPPPG